MTKQINKTTEHYNTTNICFVKTVQIRLLKALDSNRLTIVFTYLAYVTHMGTLLMINIKLIHYKSFKIIQPDQ